MATPLASEIVRQLQAAIDKFGDLPVFSAADHVTVDEVDLQHTWEIIPWGDQTPPTQQAIILKG